MPTSSYGMKDASEGWLGLEVSLTPWTCLRCVLQAPDPLAQKPWGPRRAAPLGSASLWESPVLC